MRRRRRYLVDVMPPKEPRPERTQTDESLAVERANADKALLEKAKLLERRADDVIEHAREEADEVLAAAREKADDRLSRPADSTEARAAVVEERAVEDQVVLDERAVADERVRLERAASRARLFPLERDKTDLYLLTERARSDDALANRDDFLGMVSHDLRDLLNGVVMSAALIAASSPDDEHGKKALIGAQRIERSAGRMARLIGDLVDIASIDAGKLAVVPVAVDAAALVVEAVETWGPPAFSKGILLETSALGSVPAMLDSQRILQVLGNLITNAVKFSPRDSRIQIGVENTGTETRFFVKDTGVGIQNDKLEAVFERFWQVGKNDHRGLGLGLYISKCLVEAHGGRIWAESQPGAGSTFIFTVPTAPR
jgi:signal transduction histidine kinase